MNFSKQKTFRGIELIVGIREDGHVEAIGRVLETVGQAHATATPWTPPNQKPPVPP